MKLPDREGDTTGNPDGVSAGLEDDEAIWDTRTASMALINAITNCPESLEDRIILREEFSRRGLNEAIVVSAYLMRFVVFDELSMVTDRRFATSGLPRDYRNKLMSIRKTSSRTRKIFANARSHTSGARRRIARPRNTSSRSSFVLQGNTRSCIR